jgi:L-gulonolactone oxidase
MLTSDGMVGVEQVSDTEVRVLPGTTVDQLCRELDSLGLALPAVGDIRAETVAGAALTAQHGSGRQTPSLTAGIQALELVLADGDVVTVAAAQDGDLFQAAKAGLGGFGVVTSLTLATVPTYLLHARTFPDRFENTVSTFDDWDSDQDMVEFEWYPHTDAQWCASLAPARSRTSAVPRWPAGRSGPCDRWRWPGWGGLPARLNRLSAAARPPGTRPTGGGGFSRQPEVRSWGFEYALPPMLRRRDDGVGRRRACHYRTGAHRRLRMPGWRLRAAQPSTSPPGNHRSPYQRYFDTAEAVLTELEARPRLGTAQSLGAERLASRYPRFADVQRVRNRVDPDRRFGNDYLARVLGDGA